MLSKAAKRARLYISGLGYYEVSINGRRVGDHVLSLNHTNYSHRRKAHFEEKRIGHMKSRVLYEAFDVSRFLKLRTMRQRWFWEAGGFFQNNRVEDLPYSYR